MKKIKLNVYIGKVISNMKDESVMAIEIKEPYFPSDDYNENGSNYNEFKSFSRAITYLCDLQGILGYFDLDIDSITAEVKLQIKSNKKVLNIVELKLLLEKLSKAEDYTKIRSF